MSEADKTWEAVGPTIIDIETNFRLMEQMTEAYLALVEEAGDTGDDPESQLALDNERTRITLNLEQSVEQVMQSLPSWLVSKIESGMEAGTATIIAALPVRYDRLPATLQSFWSEMARAMVVRDELDVLRSRWSPVAKSFRAFYNLTIDPASKLEDVEREYSTFVTLFDRPDPSIFKLETGTGFQIRPVILPDGDSVIYDFDYMYTTNVREPVGADEKHLGRVKRHFVHTQVQTSSFELREISRYQVALKVSRTSRGVPLFEDIPVLGAAFRPPPSDESSIQQNIILGRTTVYPTMFDLMGLRWAPHVVDVDHESLLDSEHVVRGRRRAISDYVFDTASARVDEILKLKTDHNEHYRPDLYHRRRQPSPYHPGGYTYGGQSNPNQRPGPETRPINDPSGRNFERVDRRPPEMQQPPYDLYRHTPLPPQRIEAGIDLHGVQTAPLPATVGQTWGSPGDSTSVMTR